VPPQAKHEMSFFSRFSSVSLIAEVGAGHAVRPTSVVGLGVLPTGQQGKRLQQRLWVGIPVREELIQEASEQW
jgi:hypothetical protein